MATGRAKLNQAIVEREAPANGWPEDDPRGVPLTVVGTADDDEGVPIVTFEDAEGIMFTVPREWVKHDVESYDGKAPLPHSVIDAPPGQLEEVWRDAVRQEYIRSAREKAGREWDVPWPGDVDASRVYSPLDIWEENIRGNPDFKGNPPSNFTGPWDASGVPMSAETPEAPLGSGTGWSSMVRRPRPANIRRKEDVPAEAGSGLGKWNQRWNPVTNRWEDDPELQ